MRKFLYAVTILTLAIVLLLGQLSAASATNLNTELVVNGTAETGNISGWTDDTGAGRWNSSGVYSTWALPAEGGYYFFLYNPGIGMDLLSGTMSQAIPLTDENGLFTSISGGNVSINFSISMFQGISADNEAKAVLEEYDAGGTLLKTSQVVNTTSSGAMGSYQINTQVNPNTRSFKVILSATLTRGGYAQFDKVSLKLVEASAGSAPVFGSDFPASGESDAGVTYGPVPFTISDPDAGDVNNLTFTASSTNINLVPAINIAIGGSGANRTLTITPAGNLSGESDITITASDGSKSSERTLHFIVHKVITMNTNLVENGNGTNGLASWSGNTVNLTATGNGFKSSSPGTYMSQNIDISKFSTLIDGGETQFSLSAVFPNTYGAVNAQFYTDIACLNPVGSPFLVNGSVTSLQQKIPANAKGVKITYSNTSSSYSDVYVRNISFQIINDFPKIAAISNRTTNISALTVLVNAYYTTASATLSAASDDQTIVPNAGISVGGSGFNRSITFTPLTDGVVTITLTLNDGSSTVTSSFTVTVLEPTVVTSVNAPSAGYYAAGSHLDFTVNFNNAIIGGTSSTLPLTIGGTSADASYLSGTANSITYRYTVGGSDAGVVTIGNAIDDTSLPITDTAEYDADTAISAGATGVTVVQAPQVTSSAAGGSATYGDKITFTAALSCTDSLSGTVQFKANGTNLGSPVTVSGNYASFETTESMLTAGSVSITAEFVPSGASYHFTSLTSSVYALTVNQKAVSVTGLTAAGRTYDGTTDVTLSGGTLVGALTGEDVSAVCPTTGTAASKNVGTQSVTFTAIALSGTAKDNYTLTAQPSVSVVISPKPVTATVSVSDKAYDGNTNATVTCGFTSGDIVTGDTVTVSAVGAFDTKDAGTGKTVTISGVTKDGASKDNYTVSVPASGTADITPAGITVTPNVLTKVYGHSDPTLTYGITSGVLVASETLTGSLARVTGENVGQYEITQGTVTNENNPNYNITFTSGIKLTVTQATPVVTVSVDETTLIKGKDVVVTATVAYPNKTENDAYPSTVSFTPVNATAKGTITVNGNQYTQTFTVGSDLTTPATFNASVVANGNYAGASSTTPATVTVIDQYTPTVSISSDKGAEATYGDTVTFTATVSDSHGVPRGKVQFYVDAIACGSELVLAADGTAELSLSAAPLTVGNRTVTAQYTPASDETDYKSNSSSSYSIAIVKRPVSVTGLTATGKTYDGTTDVTLSGGTLVGALTGEDVSAVCPTTGTAASKNVGTQSVTFTAIVLSGAAKDNYTLTAQPSVSVVISPKPVTATASVSDKAYDGNTNATVTCGFTSGDIVTGDTVTVSAVGAFDTKDAGTGKTVTISGVTKGGASKDNYTISVPISGTADITPAGITVTPSALTKVYGQNDPTLTYGITSGALVASETLTGSLARVTGENVGQYEITQGTVTNENNPNYNITFTSGIKLTVTQATPEITITSNKTAGYAAYGDPVTFTATVHQSGSGSVPAGSVQFWLDSEKLGLPVMLTLGSASYTTTQTGLLIGNRSVTAEFIPNTGEINYHTNTSAAYVITIGKREVTVKADDKTIYVGDPIPKANSLTYTVDGLIGGDSLLTPPTLSLPIDVSSSAAASYTITATGAVVTDKYTLNVVNGTLRVIQLENEADITPSEMSYTIRVPASTQTNTTAAASVTTNQIRQAIIAVLLEPPQQGVSPFVEITLQNAGHANAVEMTVPREAVVNLANNGLGLQLNTPIGTITFNADALSVISQNAGGNINFQIEKLDPASLPETVRSAVGNRPVYDFTVTSGNEIVSSFGGENVTVKVPYEIKDGENPNAIVVYYIDDEGNMTPVYGGYNLDERAVYFTIAHFSQYAIAYNEVTYKDVPESAWYYNAVTFCAARGITTGLGNGFFGADNPLTRGQFIVLLMRAYGLAIDESPIDNFSDAGDTYYTGYLASAKRLGITTGVGSNMFMPDEVITRQDMFTLLYRVLAVLGKLPEMKEDASLSSFGDADKISDYAKDAIENLISADIVSGSGGNLDPLGVSTRAQMAQLLYKLLT